MPLWIRTQKKHTLVECTNIGVDANSDNEFKIISIVSSYKTTLGIYSTEEKVLKVLDMIEKHIQDYSCTSIVNFGVFNMPQDDDEV